LGQYLTLTAALSTKLFFVFFFSLQKKQKQNNKHKYTQILLSLLLLFLFQIVWRRVYETFFFPFRTTTNKKNNTKFAVAAATACLP
jgi:hypothetical protein